MSTARCVSFPLFSITLSRYAWYFTTLYMVNSEGKSILLWILKLKDFVISYGISSNYWLFLVLPWISLQFAQAFLLSYSFTSNLLIIFEFLLFYGPHSCRGLIFGQNHEVVLHARPSAHNLSWFYVHVHVSTSFKHNTLLLVSHSIQPPHVSSFFSAYIDPVLSHKF